MEEHMGVDGEKDRLRIFLEADRAIDAGRSKLVPGRFYYPVLMYLFGTGWCVAPVGTLVPVLEPPSY
jgi:hypothetical protein